MRFVPSALEGEENLKKFGALIRAFNKMGGFEVQFNVVDNKTLRDAQQHPEKYPNLMVRVAGYSAFFNQLSKEVQDNIIARTENKGI